jgi:hypothetical protein
LGVHCITVAQTPNRNRKKNPQDYEGHCALRKIGSYDVGGLVSFLFLVVSPARALK